VPIVRATGGQCDTVLDANFAHKPCHERTGYAFNDFDAEGPESALSRAIGMWYSYPQHSCELMVNGMRSGSSWNHPDHHCLTQGALDLTRRQKGPLPSTYMPNLPFQGSAT
jgi:starch synthase